MSSEKKILLMYEFVHCFVNKASCACAAVQINFSTCKCMIFHTLTYCLSDLGNKETVEYFLNVLYTKMKLFQGLLPDMELLKKIFPAI